MTQRSKHKPFRSLMASESGMTLIDVSVVLVIVGLLLIPVIAGLMLLKKQSARHETHADFYTAAYTLENFYGLNGYYPCPADPKLGPDDANYGEPNVAPTIGGIPQPPGGGNCAVPGPVIEGALPFKALKMTAKESLDGWSNKITYAVTRVQTTKDTFLPTLTSIAGITIGDKRESCGITGTPINGSNYHFVFLSHGENGVGAYDANGNLNSACPTGGAASTESENCNGDRIYTYDLCMKNDVQGPNYYDDLFYANAGIYTRIPSRMWARGQDPIDIGSRGVYVGINNFEAQHELDVKGNVLVKKFTGDPTVTNKEGKSHARQFCMNSDPMKCTQAKIIDGGEPEMRCETGNGMGGISSNRVKCSNSAAGITGEPCPLGEFAVGIGRDGDGNIEFICEGAPP